MKNGPVLLATLATSLLVATVTMLVALPEIDAAPIRGEAPRGLQPARAAALPEREVLAPAAQADGEGQKISLASVPIEDQVEPEKGRAGIVLLRWPDGEPLANVTALVTGEPGPGALEVETSKRGRIDLDASLAPEVLDVQVLVEGFEQCEARVGPFERSEKLPRLMLRPLTGWYGRVVSVAEGPAARVPVKGWWIESGRPYRDDEFAKRLTASRQEKALQKLVRTNAEIELLTSELQAARNAARTAASPEAPAEGEEPSFEFIAWQDAQKQHQERTSELEARLESLEADRTEQLEWATRSSPLIPRDFLLVRADPSTSLREMEKIAEFLEQQDGLSASEAASYRRLANNLRANHARQARDAASIVGVEVTRDADPEAPAIPPTGDFVASHGDVRATALTDADGWYYIPPLEADVHGELTLLVPGQEEATDVLRLPLPLDFGRLPDIVLHKPLELRGVVVDEHGAPLEGVVVAPQLEKGWSPDLAPLRTDEHGEFTLNRPVDPVVLVVEQVGYAVTQGVHRRPESLDGLWDDLAAITPPEASTHAFFRRAYGELTGKLLPRARLAVPVDPWQSEIRVELRARPQLPVRVIDAGSLELPPPGIQDAVVTATYGGLAGRVETVRTDGLGYASLPAVDVHWQPMVVRVRAEGFHGKVTVVGPDDTGLKFGLVPLGEGEVAADEGEEPEAWYSGRVLGLGPSETARLAVYPRDRGKTQTEPSWTGETRPGGAFRIGPKLRRDQNHYVFAFTDAGGSRRAGKFGPFHVDTHRTFDIPLEPAPTMKVCLGAFETETPHRIQVRYAPFPGAGSVLADTIDLSGASGWRSEHEVAAPFGWAVRAFVEHQMEGNVPIIDFLRPEPRQRAYRSLRTAWTDWVAASEVATLDHAFADSTLLVAAPTPLDLSGVVAGLPVPGERPEELWVAALGAQGHWISAVDDNGWFAFESIPAGAYKMLIYSPPDTGEGFQLGGQGRVLGTRRLTCQFPRHDLVLHYQDP